MGQQFFRRSNTSAPLDTSCFIHSPQQHRENNYPKTIQNVNLRWNCSPGTAEFLRILVLICQCAGVPARDF